MIHIAIDPEFKALIPPLTPSEFPSLEASIVAEGCRDPLVLWDGLLLDGHNRYSICRKHHLPFHTTSLSLSGRDDAKKWVFRNALSRRNLTLYSKIVVCLRLEALLRDGAKRNLGWRKNAFQKSGKATTPLHVGKELAKLAGCSHDTISKVRLIQQKATTKQIESLVNGRASINRIYKEVRYAEKPDIEQPPILPKGKFSVILADPPWQYDFATDPSVSVSNNYPTMSFEELVEFGEKVKELAAADATMFLWSPAPKLPQALDLLRIWGFDYKSCLVWDKVKQNRGYYSSVRHELLLIAGRGRSTPRCRPKVVQSVDSVQSIPKTSNHSEKPEEFRTLIDRLYPGVKKVELFSRRMKVKGWACWGNQHLTDTHHS
jgi:N6-adenosine-specific RNA methylase IME4